MTLVRLIGNYDPSDLMRMTPGCLGVWDDVQFTVEPVHEFDYLIILNDPPAVLEVECTPQGVWILVQEPPTSVHKCWHINPSYAFRTFTTDVELVGSEYVQTHPALSWYINRNYDSLLQCDVPEKSRRLSWVTSNTRYLSGHRTRLKFMKNIESKIAFDLFGRGYRPIADKWHGLAPYKYSLAIENYRNSHYWSEKINDCFLAWTMPIYYGCTRISDYFPAEAMIQIDITASNVVEQIESALADDPWPRRLDAIAHARELVLNQYQLFPFLVQQIRQFESCHSFPAEKQLISLYPRHPFERRSIIKVLKHSPSALTELVGDLLRLR